MLKKNNRRDVINLYIGEKDFSLIIFLCGRNNNKYKKRENKFLFDRKIQGNSK